MKTREQKQKDLAALAQQFQDSTAAMFIGFNKLTVSKAVSKFAKDNPEVFKFKAGVVEGRVVALGDVEALASLPPKEVLISKIMFLVNAQAQRLATVISAVPRNLAIVVGHVSEQKNAS